jgi:hypothetical protein
VGQIPVQKPKHDVTEGIMILASAQSKHYFVELSSRVANSYSSKLGKYQVVPE